MSCHKRKLGGFRPEKKVLLITEQLVSPWKEFLNRSPSALERFGLKGLELQSGLAKEPRREFYRVLERQHPALGISFRQTWRVLVKLFFTHHNGMLIPHLL